MGKGGGGGGGYTSPHINEYEQNNYDAILNRLSGRGGGAGMYGSAAGGRVGGGGILRPGVSETPARTGSTAGAYMGAVPYPSNGKVGIGGPSGNGAGGGVGGMAENISESKVGNPLYGPAGLEFATRGYDFTPLTDAMSGFRNPGQMTQTYNPASHNPYQFNFGQLPDEYTKMAYQSGASDINRAGRDQLERLRETIGVRRPGLLMRAGEQSGRDVGKNLAGLNTQLQLNRINQNLQLGKEQQAAQAAENMGAAQFGAGEQYKGYQSRADLERSNLDNVFRNLQSLAGTGQAQIATKSGLLGSERDYQDRALQMLMDMYKTATGQANESAKLKQSEDKSTLDFLGTLAGIGTSFI